MKLNKMILTPAMLMLLPSLFVNNAHALNLNTHVEYSVDGTVVQSANDTGVSPDSISSSISNLSPDEFEQANAWAHNNNGIGTVAVEGMFAYGGFNELKAASTNSDTIINTSGNNQEFFYDFEVFGPRLSISDFAGANAGMTGAPTASYDIAILVNGLSVWDSSAILNGGQIGHTLTESGVDLGGAFFVDPTYNNAIFGYNFDDYVGQISLGTFGSGESFLFETTMEVNVSASGFELGGFAAIGDPGNITAGGMQGTVSAVPEPSSIALFGLGLGVIGATIARRKKNLSSV